MAIADATHLVGMTDRWFTDAAPDGAVRIRPNFTPLEQDVFVEILTFAHDPTNAEMELLKCLDADGTQLFDTSTGRKSAEVTDGMKAAIGAGKVRQWHNHPSQDSLSHHDWLCAATSADLEILALNERGSIFVGRVPEWEDRLEALFGWLPRLGGDVELYMSNLARSRGLEDEVLVRLSTFTGHVLNTALAQRTVVRYAYSLRDDDDWTVCGCERLGIISDGVAFAARAIQDWLDTYIPVSSPEIDDSSSAVNP